MAKFKVTKQSVLPLFMEADWLKDFEYKKMPDFIELEGELMEEKKLPPLPGEIDFKHIQELGDNLPYHDKDSFVQDALLRQLVLRYTQLIIYLKAREL